MMESEIKFHEYKKWDSSNSLVLTSFPTIGLVSTISGSFLVRSLKMKLVGAIVSGKLPPVALIHEGRASPAFRIYSSQQKCGPDNRCDQLTIILSEFMPRLDAIEPLSAEVLNWADEKDVGLLVSLEGLNSSVPLVGDPKVFGVGSTSRTRKLIKEYKLEPLEEGMVSGFPGVLLYQATMRNQDVLTLLAETRPDYPDARAAARLLEILGKMVPNLKIDPGPLLKEAELIEKQILESIENAKPSSPVIPELPLSMYG
ncbi:MAG: proteasome assembly chaperone family protein [Thermoplasmata archaeon]